MAKREHMKLLKQGVEQWNEWRKQHPEVQPDLSNANLRRIDLHGANLNEAILIGADLRHANVALAIFTGATFIGVSCVETNEDGNFYRKTYVSRITSGKFERRLHPNTDIWHVLTARTNFSEAILAGANLSGVDLSRVDLSGAYLNSADLSGANLREAFLSSADLSETNLSYANLSDADLSDIDLSNAHIIGTQFDNLDLRNVIGLETVQHDGPSTIGLDTIYRSHGQIPEAFLRGAGVPETFITNMPALVDSMSPIEFYSCFISYSHQNEDFAKRLHADLQAKGVRCWFAEEDLKIGDHYHQRIDEAIRLYDKLILVLSDAAVQSAWIEREVVAAREKEDRHRREVLFPLRLDDAVMETNQAWAADVRRRWHIGDFTRWKDHDSYQQAFERLLRDLKAEVKRGNNG